MTERNIFKQGSANKTMSRKGQLNILAIVIIIAILGAGVYYFSNGGLSITGVNYDYVYKANWGHIKCVQNFDYDIFTGYKYVDSTSTLKCDDYTNECKIDIHRDREGTLLSSWATGQYKICDLNGNSCSGAVVFQTSGTGNVVSFTLPVGKEVVFSKHALIGSGAFDQIVAQKSAKSFYIEGEENGKTYVQESCVLSAELRSKTTSDGLNELSKTGANSFQNYLIDYIQTATRTYPYQNKQVVCQARAIYSITNQAMLDGSTIKIQGDKIDDVQCCPAEANCDPATFKFKVVTPPRECTTSSECSNGGNPIAIDSTSYYQFSCQSGTCVKGATQSAECTLTAECVRKYGDKSVCDISIGNFGHCITSTTPLICGDGVCNSLNGENFNTCPQDCTCAKGETLVTETSGSLWYKITGIGSSTTRTYCVKSDFWKSYGWLIILAIAGTLLYFFRGDRRFVYGIVGATLLYFAWTYVGKVTATLFIILAIIGVAIFLLRKPLWMMLRALI